MASATMACSKCCTFLSPICASVAPSLCVLSSLKAWSEKLVATISYQEGFLTKQNIPTLSFNEHENLTLHVETHIFP